MKKSIYLVFIFIVVAIPVNFAITKKNPDASIQIYSRVVTDGITISSNGSIGVGTAAPVYKLDVAGTVNATGFIGNGSQLTQIQWSSITGAPLVVSSGQTISESAHTLTANYAVTAGIALDVVSISGARINNGSITNEKIVTIDGSKIIGTTSPGNHAITHQKGGADEITISMSQVQNLTISIDSKSDLGHTHGASTITAVSGSVVIGAVNTASVALTANYIDWANIGNKSSVVTSGMTVNTANYASNTGLLGGQTAAQLTVGTANIAITANYIDWANIGNKSSVVTSGTTVSTANYATTANYAVTAGVALGVINGSISDAKVSDVSATKLTGAVSVNSAVINNSLVMTVVNSSSNIGVGTTAPNSKFTVNGSFATALNTYSAAATLGNLDSVAVVNASAGSVTITLPSPASINGRQYTVKKTDNTLNTVTIGTLAGNIEGNSTYVLTAPSEFVNLASDGTNWVVVGCN
ncbi:MAG: hypothetical protein PHV30_03545 [Candidatus Margulisbacteria bacterium]|nr:hypothetical protein [Candidatus Margulisiibacteriota bacterium]